MGNAFEDAAHRPGDRGRRHVSTAFYKYLKLDENFIKASEIAQNMRINGQLM